MQRFSIAGVLDELARLRMNQDDSVGAEPLYREALALARDTLGENHPHVGTFYMWLGQILHTRGDPAAEEMLRRALAIHRSALGDEHKDVTPAMYFLATHLVARDQLVAAESLYRGIIRIREGHELEALSKVWVGRALGGLGEIALKRDDVGGAEAKFREAVGFLRKYLPPESQFRLAAMQQRLGEVLLAQRRYDQAEPQLLEAVSALEAKYGPSNPRTIAALQALVALYDAWGNPEKAAEYRVRVESASARAP